MAMLVAVAACSSSGLDETRTRDFVGALEGAIKSCNVRSFDSMLAPDIKVTTAAIPQLNRAEQSIGLDQMVAGFDKSCQNRVATGATYASTLGKIQVAGDGQSATAELTTQSAHTGDGHHIETSTQQTYTVALRNGQPRLVAVNEFLTRIVIDGKQLY
jgi:hypothetical protein